MSETTEKLDSENAMEQYFFRASAEDFMKIPGSPIAFWLSPKMLNSFESNKSLSELCEIREGINTGDNDQFLRRWTEVDWDSFYHPAESGGERDLKWFAHRKGGKFRKWYGNRDYVLNWECDGKAVHDFHNLPLDFNGAPVRGKAFFYRSGLSWSRISSGNFALRFYEAGMTYDSTAPSVFADPADMFIILGFLNSRVVFNFLAAMSPTLDFRITSLGRLPFLETTSLLLSCEDKLPPERLIEISRLDWDSYETSWDFTCHPLLKLDDHSLELGAIYGDLRVDWQNSMLEMQRLEEENNCIFIDAYDLQDEVTPEVPLKDITLTCNPHYRYGGKKSEEEVDALLLADTMREFISYAVGCMFGRYSLDKEGLILANQGETLEDYIVLIPDPQFTPDDDNVVPLVDFDGDWFEDDISERFKQFLKTTFGEEHYSENLAFIEEAIGKDIKKFFLKDFYTDHIKRYKKRPIYWLFSSPKGSFNALIYMHRYRPDTASIVLNDYLREFRTKLTARKQSFEQVGISASASQKEKTQAIKAIEKINKVLDEINEYEHDTLYPLATRKIEIDLDDGVKHNYPLFGKALKKVTGLS